MVGGLGASIRVTVATLLEGHVAAEDVDVRALGVVDADGEGGVKVGCGNTGPVIAAV